MRPILSLLTVCGLALACGGAAATPPAAGLSAARAIVREHRDEDLGICDFQGGWGYAALRALNEAGDVANAAAEDAELDPLRETDLFRRWYVSRTATLGSDPAILKFLESHPDWHELSGVPKQVHFGADGRFSIRAIGSEGPPETEGRWSVHGGKVQLETGGGTIDGAILKGPYALGVDAEQLGTFEIDPIVGDC